MKIFYVLSAYISHRQAGLEYMSALKSLGHQVECNYPALISGPGDNSTLTARHSFEFADEPELARAALEADLVVLHEDPSWYNQIFKRLPSLQQKKLVICLPWENETLPDAFIRPLQAASAIWTPSDFCRRAFAQHFENVEVLPHVVRRLKPSPAALVWARDLSARHGAENGPCFLSVVDGLNPRKNLEGLLTAFSAFRQSSRIPAKLLIKQYRVAMPIDHHPDVISVSDMLDDGHMAALYASCTAYVSAHRSEGWGLGISNAMAFGKVAIATAYSGNMEFMDETNSIPIPYQMAPVSQQMGMKIPLFTPEMRWAEPDLAAMAEAMRRVAEGRVSPELARNAAEITRRFGPEAIAARLADLIAKVA